MKVICFGDSNTYGYDPRSLFGGRYDPENRWVDLLAEKTGWQVVNQGMNGREIPRGPISVPADTDLLILMLGTNDLLQGNSAAQVTERMEGFLTALSIPREHILLIAPPPVVIGAWVPREALVEESKELARSYRSLAEKLSIPFADAGTWHIPLAYDGVHFTEEGHRVFGEGLYKELLP